MDGLSQVPIKVVGQDQVSICDNFSTSNQYEIVAESFISGVSLFQNPFNPSLFVFNDFGKIKIEAVYSNITVDNETKLWVPVGVQISTSPTVEKVSFYSVIVIK